ncbi:MAG: HD domain-containing protein [Clostridia bacterium]|nr:HD domain-containing protein [Clostridia bacterium]
MKRWRIWQISLFVAFCILVNYGGRVLAAGYDLPLWLDAFGTVLCAYAGGPVCGAIVGLASNIIYGMMNGISYIYALTNMAMGLIVGFAARRKRLDGVVDMMTVAVWTALAAVVISVPLNIIFYGGSTGNLWGDGVIGFLRERGLPLLPCQFLGQFYVEFLDKLLTLALLLVTVRLVRRVRGHGGAGRPAPRKLAAALVAGLALGVAVTGGAARAENDAIDYNDYVQTIYNSNNGLPCGEANDIAQTNDGILWIGTYAGLYRYNGREFTWMDGYESVRNVNCLYVDEEGRLWIGTNDNGLSICINERISNVVDQTRGLPSNSVRSIIQSSDGYYYVGTTGSMQILTLKNGLKRVSTLREVNYADKIAADDAGHVAAVTSDGRLFLMQKGVIQSSLQLPKGEELFNSVCFDPDGVLLVGTSTNHIYVFEIGQGWFDEKTVRTCEGLKNINDLYYVGGGELFISADNGVGYITRENEFEPVNTNDFNNSIDNMLIDYQGNLWFTSSRLGLLRMAPSAFKDVYTTVGMDSRVVNAVARWQGEYYFGTDKGLDVVDAACKKRITNALTQKLEGVRIRCLLVDSSDHLWVCTYGSGLLEVEPDGTEHLYNSDSGSFGNRARVVTELSNGTVMAGGDTGISFIRDHEIIENIGYADGLINSMILTATELPDGRILAGTDGDGIAVLVDGKVDHMLTRENGLSSGVILRTIADPKGEGVFIVTSNGLCYMDEAGAIRSLDNFPYYNNYDIWARDRNTLFVMSSAGIYVVDRDELLSGSESITYDLLDARRGLTSALTANSWNYCDEHGDLFLPCDKGVFIIDTERYTSGINAYRMSVKRVRLDNTVKEIGRRNTIEIGRGVGKVELVPEIINYTIQDPYVGYWLEGFDKDWNIMPQSALGPITYTNLPTGSYTFHLAVFDNNKGNILGERDYILVKAREIYDNPWFVVYIVLVPMLVVIWVTWSSMRRRMQRALERQAHEMALMKQQIQMGNETIIAIAKAVDAKDERTSQHSQRVSQYSVLIARELGLSDKECENLRRAALMHDIGKIGIPDRILNKPARLDDDEYAIMKSHVTRGAEILKDFTLIEHVVEGARYHHERYDGRGYPDGLKGEEIPLYGRIIGVADAFDAMTANRIYRKQMDFGYVLNEMKNGRGTQFDPQIVDIMLRLIDEGKIDLNTLYPARTEE